MAAVEKLLWLEPVGRASCLGVWLTICVADGIPSALVKLIVGLAAVGVMNFVANIVLSSDFALLIDFDI